MPQRIPGVTNSSRPQVELPEGHQAIHKSAVAIGYFMNTEASPIVVYVTYQGAPQDRFDRDYYVEVHLPLVMKAWNQYGLLSVKAFFPATLREGTLAICECVFRDEGALEAAFASPEVSAVMADVPRFTDIAPLRVRVAAL
jgi:uncharacterized protein (TIGR02118 family)